MVNFANSGFIQPLVHYIPPDCFLQYQLFPAFYFIFTSECNKGLDLYMLIGHEQFSLNLFFVFACVTLYHIWLQGFFLDNL